MKIICSQVLVFVLIVLSGASGSLLAQDARFSQFFTTPHLVNPAMNGLFQGDYQVMLNYRSQWGNIMESPYRTVSMATAMKVYPHFAPCDYVGLGFNVLADQAGALNFGTVQVNMAGTYYKSLNGYGTSYLALGFTGGVGHRSLKVNPFTDFLDQPEALPANAFLYTDLSSGLLWSYKPHKKAYFYLGGAIYHLNRPDMSHFATERGFAGGDEPLAMRYVGHGGGTFTLSDRFRFRPSAMIERQGPNTEIMGGGFVQFLTNEAITGKDARPENSIHFGGFWRYGDAAVVAARMDFDHYYLTISYDVTASKLSEANRGAGGLEVSIAKALFRQQRPTCPSPVDCPAF